MLATHSRTEKKKSNDKCRNEGEPCQGRTLWETQTILSDEHKHSEQVLDIERYHKGMLMERYHQRYVNGTQPCKIKTRSANRQTNLSWKQKWIIGTTFSLYKLSLRQIKLSGKLLECIIEENDLNFVIIKMCSVKVLRYWEEKESMEYVGPTPTRAAIQCLEDHDKQSYQHVRQKSQLPLLIDLLV